MGMPIQERIDSVAKVRQWKDKIPLRYVYTTGVAGELFFEWLKKGKIEGSRCDSCKVTYLPPRMYCLDCFREVRSFVNVDNQGKVAALTSLGDAGPSYVYVTYAGVRGGILHRVFSGKAKMGARAVAIFKPAGERKGSILDILGFKIS